MRGEKGGESAGGALAPGEDRTGAPEQPSGISRPELGHKVRALGRKARERTPPGPMAEATPPMRACLGERAGGRTGGTRGGEPAGGGGRVEHRHG